MKTGSPVIHEGPVAALPVQQQPNRHIYPQAVGVSLGDPQGQVPLLTQSSNIEQGTMSEPVPLLHRAAEFKAHADGQKELKTDLKQNGHCECSQSSDVAPGTVQDMEMSNLGSGGAECLKHCGAILPQQQERNPAETCLSSELHSAFSPDLDENSCDDLPESVNATEDISLDLLRIVKHKPSAIVFCDYDCISDNQVIFANESSDGGDSSSSVSEEEVGDDDVEEDDFPETLQYKEFLVSRQRRNLSRNRKGSRRREDAQPDSRATIWQKPTNKGKPEFTGSQQEQDTGQDNGNQVRKTSQERNDNKQTKILFTV